MGKWNYCDDGRGEVLLWPNASIEYFHDELSPKNSDGVARRIIEKLRPVHLHLHGPPLA